MRLARIQGRTIGEVLRDNPAHHLRLWHESFATEPEGDDRLDWVAGLLCSTMANLAAPTGEPATPDQFIPAWWESPEEREARDLAVERLKREAFVAQAQAMAAQRMKTHG